MRLYFNCLPPKTPIARTVIWDMFVQLVQRNDGQLTSEQTVSFFLESALFLHHHNTLAPDLNKVLDAQYVFCKEFFGRYADNADLMGELGEREETWPLISGALISAASAHNDHAFISRMKELSDSYGFSLCGPLADPKGSGSGLISVLEDIRENVLALHPVCTFIAVSRDDYDRHGVVKVFRPAAPTVEEYLDAELDICRGVFYALRGTGIFLIVRELPEGPTASGFVSDGGSIFRLMGEDLEYCCNCFLPSVCQLRSWVCADSLSAPQEYLKNYK